MKKAMQNFKKYSLIIFAIIVLGLLIAGVMHFYQTHTTLPTYFSYNKAEQNKLDELNSDQEITAGSLRRWDNVLLNLIKEYKFGDILAACCQGHKTADKRRRIMV